MYDIFREIRFPDFFNAESITSAFVADAIGRIEAAPSSGECHDIFNTF
jgi:hypothetical protein